MSLTQKDMKYTIIVRDDEQSQRVAQQIKDRIIHKQDDNYPDIVITVGGDGTILRAVKKYFDYLDNTVFFGINTGHLGFYANWDLCELDSFINAINGNKNCLETFNLLEFTINDDSKNYALNEVTIRNNYCVEEFDIYIDDELFETFRGTGMCLSTTNGSTALNKSLGGCIIDTDFEAIQLAEIASVNSNAYRTLGSPALFSKKRKIEVKKNQPAKIMVTADQEVYDVVFEKLQVSLSNKKVSFAKNKDRSFWSRVNQSFI